MTDDKMRPDVNGRSGQAKPEQVGRQAEPSQCGGSARSALGARTKATLRQPKGASTKLNPFIGQRRFLVYGSA